MKIAIVGYGNLGRGAETAIAINSDMELAAVFTRRAPASVKLRTPGVPVFALDEIERFKGQIDVLLLCGGSATDLPEMTPALAESFNVVDSFDTHASIPAHFDAVNSAALRGGHTAVISVGWDPGLFSVSRLYAASVLPDGESYTFWGRGVSQGHSDAIRRIDGVADARQYTVPIAQAVEAVRSGENPVLTTRQKHLRECYVVAEEGADRERITREIKTMPNYFADYDTTVTFITKEEMQRDHSALPHGGHVIRCGETSDGVKQTVEFSLKLDSNPEFTAGVLCAYARAACRMAQRGQFGCKTAFDIAPGDLSPFAPEYLRAHML